MMEFIEGELVERGPGMVTLRVGGIGFRLSVPLSTFDRLPAGGPLKLFTHLVPREDAFLLFGFLAPEERELFLLLQTVSGVGPRLALKVLSGFPPTQVARAVAEGEVGLLCKVPGIGRKTAERLIVELKDAVKHLAAADASRADIVTADAVVALIKLGAGRVEAERAVEKARRTAPPSAGAEDIVRECLRQGLA